MVELTAPVLLRAVDLTRTHGLRGADAVQLACAAATRDQAPGRQLTVVGSDQELNAAALAEGMLVFDPTESSP